MANGFKLEGNYLLGKMAINTKHKRGYQNDVFHTEGSIEKESKHNKITASPNGPMPLSAISGFANTINNEGSMLKISNFANNSQGFEENRKHKMLDSKENIMTNKLHEGRECNNPVEAAWMPRLESQEQEVLPEEQNVQRNEAGMAKRVAWINNPFANVEVPISENTQIK